MKAAIRSGLIFFAAISGTAIGFGLAVLIFGVAALAAFISLLSLLAAVFFVTTFWSVAFGAPFVPTDRRNVEGMLALAALKPGEKLVDLGAGDGRILIAAARAGARAEGWEINPYLWLWSRWQIRLAGVEHLAKARLGSYWPRRLSDADVVTLFLIDTKMPPMERKLRVELKPGSRVVSYIFKFPSWPVSGASGTGLRLYVQPKA